MLRHFFSTVLSASIQSLNDSLKAVAAVSAYSRVSLDLIKQNIVDILARYFFLCISQIILNLENTFHRLSRLKGTLIAKDLRNVP